MPLIAQLNLICKNIAHNCGVLALDLDPFGFDGHIGSESLSTSGRVGACRHWSLIGEEFYTQERGLLSLGT